MTDTVQDLNRPSNAISVHEPYGFVALDMWAGDDLTVVNSARVSFDKVSQYQYTTSDDKMFTDWDKAMDHEEDLAYKNGKSLDDFDKMVDIPQHLSAEDEGLINHLMKFRHGTPFEMIWTRWHIKAPILVFREWHRHRIASINEMSARYVELKPEFYLPDDEHVRVQVGKPGHYTYEPKGAERTPNAVGSGDTLRFTNTHLVDGENVAQSDILPLTYGEHTRAALNEAYTEAYERYQELMKLGIAKEIARACLPVAIYSEMYWSSNLRALLNFLSLRNHPRALQEIRDYAAVMEDVLKKQMPVVYEAFVNNGRIAP